MNIDHAEAVWLSGFITDINHQLDEHPGLTIEVDGRPQCWLQVIPQCDNEMALISYLLNIPVETDDQDVMTVLKNALHLPPDTLFIEKPDNGPVKLSIRGDIPPLAFSFFLIQLFETLLNRAKDEDLTIQLEFGF